MLTMHAFIHVFFLLMDACLLSDAKLCCTDDTLPDGSNVGRGDLVVYLPYPMGRMKFLWGDDEEVFKPERWLNKDVVFQPESPLKFTAFQDKDADFSVKIEEGFVNPVDWG